jgi:hypothetical protein
MSKVRFYDPCVECVMACCEICRITQEENSHKWISVTERLPEEGVWVLALRSNKKHHIALWQHNHWSRRAGLVDKITHWMPLPEPPQEDKP